ncbi:MAG: MATE family efflux transporter [Oxalicibacterium faecigallinarum]|uniref:MATE family efflux transporter n=1 Tax=Oxalicibacterium faecigallinarum TaxID=573741 RepID=UPI002808F54F|nr:MATE family efflux transporter [Oxalicibacterium faecigallinarum]MDQ7970420.1 MATE family efflux transporter [Oxalicibacterium faecigallinarum]
MNAPALSASIKQDAKVLDPRTRRMLEAPILPLLLMMAWPNMLIMLTQASSGLIETWWIAKLGTDALAGMALVFPAVMLVTMVSAGAIGGGISSSVARALGRGDQDTADGLVIHAGVISTALGVISSVVFLGFGTQIYQALGGHGGELHAALEYSDVMFAGIVFMWLMNGLASVIRGTGNMSFPAIVICTGVAMLIPASPLLIFGFGPIPAMGVAGGALAILIFNVLGTIAMAWYILAGRCIVKFKPVTLSMRHIGEILRIGAISSIMAIQTNIVIAVATAMVASIASVGAVAGFGTGVRLEYLLVPLIFGIGAPLVALVGTNIGAGHHERALKIALIGAAIAFIVTEAIGLTAAIWPEQWMTLFSTNAEVIQAGSTYLRIVGPCYGFYGIGLALYFASQGAGKLKWPLIGGCVRVGIALGGSWFALRLGIPVHWIFICLAVALLLYGCIILIAVQRRTWFR